MNTVYLSLGSNMGDREQVLAQAAAELANFAVIKKRSSMYESPAWGKTDQADFLNTALLVETELEPLKFLEKLRVIEQKLGRQQREKWGSREIDIDIIFWNTETLGVPKLTIPHPFWKERAFVVIPLAEIAPDFVPPEEELTLHEIARNFSDGPTPCKSLSQIN